MKLDPNAIIGERKLAGYLLTVRGRNDKSGFFALAGYTQSNWQRLESDLREQFLSHEAEFSRRSEHGDVYVIRGQLRGPNDQMLELVTVWIIEVNTGRTRLVTAVPSRRADRQ